MNCPKCNVSLSMSDRQGVEIDFCPQCRGVWLDRGELDKIIERAGASANQVVSPPAVPQAVYPPPGIPAQQRDYRPDYDDDDRRSSRDGYGSHRNKKKGFLGDLFDF